MGSAVFDDPNLVSAAGLVPVLKLAERAGLQALADQHLSVPTDKGANAGLKVASLVAGMVAGADSIDDMAVLRQGGMGRVFARAYAPSTLGSFLRSFTFGHVRQLDAVASRFLTGLTDIAPTVAGTADELVLVDVDDTIIEVHGHAKQGSGYGYSGVRGLNALLATVTTVSTAPLIVAQRLRKGACGSPRGANRLVADALKTVRTLHRSSRPLLRADSAFYGRPTVSAAIKAGADVSVTVRLDPRVKRAIGSIGADTWQTIAYTDAIYDETTQQWISRAEVAEVPFTAFSSRKKTDQVPGRLVVRRIPDLNPTPGQDSLFDTWRFHAFFTTSTLDTVTADKTHRGHAIIEQVHADLKHSALAHLPSSRFCANAAWLALAVMAFQSRSHSDRPSTGESDHSHHPPETDQRPSPDRLLSTAHDVAPAAALALGGALDHPVHPGLRTSRRHTLTIQPATAPPRTRNTRAARPGAHLRPAARTQQTQHPISHPECLGGSRLTRRLDPRVQHSMTLIRIFRRWLVDHGCSGGAAALI